MLNFKAKWTIITVFICQPAHVSIVKFVAVVAVIALKYFLFSAFDALRFRTRRPSGLQILFLIHRCIVIHDLICITRH